MSNGVYNFQNVEQLTEALLKAQLSGGSPTQFGVANIVWHGIVEPALEKKKKKSHSTTTTTTLKAGKDIEEQITIMEGGFYPALHQTAFLDNGEDKMLVEKADWEDLNERDPNGNTALMWATSEGKEAMVQLLVDQGSVVNTQNFVGETALYLAAARGFPKLCDFLLENGGDPRLTNLEGASPLHIAAAEGHLPVIDVLVRRGAYLNATDEGGDTPLHYAVREGRKEAVELLIHFNAAKNLRNEDMESPLDLAIEFGEEEIAHVLADSEELVQHQLQQQQSGRNAGTEEALFFGMPSLDAPMVPRQGNTLAY